MRCEFLESTPSYSNVIDSFLYFNWVLTTVIKRLHFPTLIPSRPHACNQSQHGGLTKTYFHFTVININIPVFPLPKHTEKRAFPATILIAAPFVCCVGNLGPCTDPASSPPLNYITTPLGCCFGNHEFPTLVL